MDIISILIIPLMLIARAIPIAVITEILRRIVGLTTLSAGQFVIFNSISYSIGIIVGGYGYGDVSGPKFSLAAQEYLLPSLLLTIYNLVRLKTCPKNGDREVVPAIPTGQAPRKILKLLGLWILGIVAALGVLVSMNDYTPNYFAAFIFLLIGLPSFVRGYRVLWRSLMT